MKDLNFFAPYHTVKKDRDNSGNFLIGLGVLLLVGSICFNTALQVMKVMELTREKETLIATMESEAYQAKLEDARAQLAEFQELKREKMFFTDLQGNMTKIHRVNEYVMRFLSKELIRDLFLMELSIEDQQIIIGGRALNKKAIAQFEYDLRNTGKFEKIRISEIVKPEEEDKYYDFTMTIETKDVSFSEAK
ncbi:PilN domain-containing protein [Filifactor villosus]|uniref:PilN domain-containing protein n=1 Tax=Filifactor villosus TaxID=29374 RepID=A0ABV9QRM4_9FIRM